MLFSESMPIALFLMVIVFAVLVGLYLCIRFFSFMLKRIEEATTPNKGTQP